MDENNFEINGAKYKAVNVTNSVPHKRCNGCFFNITAYIHECMNVAPECSKLFRQDERNVIFVEDKQ